MIFFITVIVAVRKRTSGRSPSGDSYMKIRKRSRKSQLTVALVTSVLCLLSWIALPTPPFPHPDAYAKGDKGGGGAAGGGGASGGGAGGGAASAAGAGASAGGASAGGGASGGSAGAAGAAGAGAA